MDDYSRPLPLQFQGSALARRLLALAGWALHFEGLPAQQGVIVVYPHTSNWDFIVMILAKWALGVPVNFWGKDSLFAIPLFGSWLRWVGGVPVKRTVAGGVVAQARGLFARHKAANSYFWLALAPEGTRKRIPGWRSGFYQTALAAGVPLGLVQLDFGRRHIDVNFFMHLSGDETRDMLRIAQHFEGVRGKVPGNASPVVLLDASVSRSDTVVK